MTLIKKPAQLDVPKTVKAMIYGQPGTGKTTLALSAPRPLLLDFDGGVHRVNFGHQCDTLPVQNWTEAVEVLKENLSAYDTIVVDTVGKMMDYLINHVEEGGISGWKKWEKINEGFASFTRELSKKGKNIIFVAHRDTRKEGDDATVFIPSLREKNYTAIVTELDLLGYVEMKGTTRSITFNPTSRNDGKNTCNLPPAISIPAVVDKNGNALQNVFFQTHIINPYIANQQKRANATRAYGAVIAEIKENIALIVDEMSANDFIDRVNSFEHVGNSKAVASQLMAAKARELGIVLNKEKRYEKPAA
jgi:phage nucleotide-binding protein